MLRKYYVTVFIAVLTGCKPAHIEVSDCQTDPKVAEQKTELLYCPHPEMSIYIKPHPPKFLQGRKVHFCYYEKKGGSITLFQISKKGVLTTRIDNIQSIDW
ncbi:hypothetical protein EHR05_13590 [Leptospira licerasiae]|nr:hypothetical protein EHR05_13590 [Leptospira licerasiae]